MTMDARARRVWDSYFGPGMDKAIDAFGLKIAKAAYGNENSRYGWLVDRIRPESMGGSDDFDNLRPLGIKTRQIIDSWD